jgi:hypothetical protein
MIEIRRDLYLDEPAHEIRQGYDLVVGRLAQLIGTLAE